MTSILWQMEDDLNSLENKEDLSFLAKWKMTLILRKMGDKLNFKVNLRQPQLASPSFV